ncbi:MAG TPA: peptidoglycan-associated lipoprotein Pal [Gammaproteobacteria bacterium]|jgi:peptidoglycan-associated lipoprotein
MKNPTFCKPWMIAAVLALFVSACATTQDEIIEDGPPTVDESATDGTTSGAETTDGAAASGLEGSGDSGATAIADSEREMTAAEMLEQSDGPLANRTIYFEYDSASLTDESIAILETHGNFIAANGEVRVRLEGHADERGSREYNIGLGDRRAQSVRRVLLFQGAATNQIDTVSYGEERPVDSGHSEEAWAKNRRVELIYTVN